MVNQLAPHVKAFESYPGYQFAQGNYALSQVWNGDARQGFNSFKDPSHYAWGLGRARHRAVDGQLDHREGRPAP